MQVLLLMYQDEKALQKLPREEFGRIHGAFAAYVEALNKAGALVANHGLRPTAEAKSVRKDAVLDEARGVRVTVSIGYAALEPQDNDHGAWIAHADRALYAAKAAGRNRCMAADVRRAA